ncbi:hypothetical protein [Syntrophomonas wolfei]|jgi:hypothetical protein|uniref:hypothetical protein n=1 Tax=Syntrophomonas wolfei TaxID=863 RepID=UPI000773A1CE|nr:hypothetical protein [Syntrophomonas wolfei]
MIALVLIGFGMVALIQIPGLVRKQWWRELLCFAVLLFMGLILSVMISMGIEIPPVTTIINETITGMLGM